VELVAHRDERVDQVPQLRLLEKLVLLQAGAVADLVGEHVLEVVKQNLYNPTNTVTKPLEPQKPSFWNSCLSGKR
jgi:hypothetical protein